jgi:putative nucleotide binding protein
MEDTKNKEEFAIVLDFLPNGYPFDRIPAHQKSPIAQVIGKDNFTLLEVTPKKNIFFQPYDEIYIGSGKRDQVHYIVGKLPLTKLTGTATKEIEFVINEIISKNEKKFVAFFNKANPLSTRMHQLELLPGVGKKHMWQIIEERREKEFDSFDDIKKRVRLLPEPKKTIIKRIMLELQGKEKYNLFVDCLK